MPSKGARMADAARAPSPVATAATIAWCWAHVTPGSWWPSSVLVRTRSMAARNASSTSLSRWLSREA